MIVSGLYKWRSDSSWWTLLYQPGDALVAACDCSLLLNVMLPVCISRRAVTQDYWHAQQHVKHRACMNQGALQPATPHANRACTHGSVQELRSTRLERQQLSEQLVEANSIIATTKGQIEQQAGDLTNMTKAAAHAEKRCEELSSKLGSMEEQSASLRAELARKADEVCGGVPSVIAQTAGRYIALLCSLQRCLVVCMYACERRPGIAVHVAIMSERQHKACPSLMLLYC